ncbi:MAG: O-antigen ligase family protein [Candidatus Moranbacteria bacterium]|nr:O-antigen ligase family protein [Candidatus Moranbacteria bacterium]
MIKIKFGWVSFNILELLIAILFLIWIFNKEKKYPPTGDHPQGDKIPNTKYILPVSLIFIGLIVSVLANKNYYVGLGAIKGWFIVPIVFVIIFFDALKYDEGLLKKSLLAMFFSGTAISIVGVVYKFLGVVTFDDRLKIFWDSPNQLAMFLAVPFLIGLFFTLQEREARTKRLYILSLTLVGLGLYFTYSYGAWLAVAVALSVIIWLKYSKKDHKKYLAIFAILLVAFLAWASLNKYKSIESLGARSSLASRVTIWKSAGLMVEKNPLFGIGPGNFQEKYLEYQKYFPPYLEWSAPQPHNIFLAFWLESGLLGLAGFVILLFYFFQDNKKAIANNRGVGILLLGIMIYILAHGLVDTTYWRNDLAILFWMIIAMNFYVSKEKSN